MKPYASKRLIKNARSLRHEPTEPEKRLWSCLRNGQIEGAKFRRQHPIGAFVLDFHCDAARLAIEIDGDTHADQALYDERQTAWLGAQDIEVIRFTNRDVIDNLEGVVETAASALRARPHRLAALTTLSRGERVQDAGEHS